MNPEGFGEVAEKLRRSTVQVTSGSRVRTGSGSGVICGADGTIVTNAHVLQGGKDVRVQLWDGRWLPAQVTGRDDRMDMAKLKLEARDLPALPWRGSSPVRPGELVVAVGNPLGFVGALSTGVIHAVGAVGGLGRRIWVQAAIRLAPGNSGGPLADTSGNVVGINTMVVPGAVSGGLALAIPSDAVQSFLRSGSRPSLGVIVQLVSDAAVGIGLLVLKVIQNGAADRASLMVGDLLIAVNNRKLREPEDLGDAMDQSRDGVLKLRFLRGDRQKEREVSVSLTEPVVSEIRGEAA